MESVCAGDRTGGSNPPLSVSSDHMPIRFPQFNVKKNTVDLNDEKSWHGGPLCEVGIATSEVISAEDLNSLLQMLGLEVFCTRQECNELVPLEPNKRVQFGEHARSAWRISRQRLIGAKVSTPTRHFPPVIWISVPPIQMTATFAGFPWVFDDWEPSRETLQFHAIVLRRIRMLHNYFPIKSVFIQEESMCGRLRGASSGIYLLPRVAELFGWGGNSKNTRSSLFVNVPFDELLNTANTKRNDSR